MEIEMRREIIKNHVEELADESCVHQEMQDCS